MSDVSGSVVPPPVLRPPVSKPRRYWPQRLVIVFISLLIYAVACACPCLNMAYTDNAETFTWFGWRLLMLGWTGIFVGQIAWFSNILLLFALIPFLFRLWITTAVMLLLAVLVGTDTFALWGQTLPADEGGVRHMQLTSMGIGVYIWFAALVVPLVGCLVMRLIAGRRNPQRLSRFQF